MTIAGMQLRGAAAPVECQPQISVSLCNGHDMGRIRGRGFENQRPRRVKIVGRVVMVAVSVMSGWLSADLFFRF
jgi:hypothetical protein